MIDDLGVGACHRHSSGQVCNNESPHWLAFFIRGWFENILLLYNFYLLKFILTLITGPGVFFDPGGT